jgi:hypothetical protein
MSKSLDPIPDPEPTFQTNPDPAPNPALDLRQVKKAIKRVAELDAIGEILHPLIYVLYYLLS